MKKISRYLTLQDIIDFANENKIPYDTTIGICIADKEIGSIAGGVIADMVGIKGYDEDGEEIHNIDGHVYCKNMDRFSIEAEDDVIIITDGYHYGD